MFRVSAVLRPPPPEKTGTVEGYLPSAVPVAMNILEPLGHELLLSGAAFQDEASTPTQTSVAPPAVGESLPLKAIPRRAFRAIPAVSSRLRYHRPTGTQPKSSLVATLELDALKFAQHPIELTKIQLSYVGGEIQRMLNADVIQSPLRFEATDNLVCIYTLESDPASRTGQGFPVKTLDVAIDARVLISKTSTPKIEIRWRQNIDFAAIASAASRPGRHFQRENRPASIVTGEAKSALSSQGRSPPLDGITATFAKSDKVYVGDPFTWEISIVNRTARERQFAFAMLPKRPGLQQSRRTTRSTTIVGGGSQALAEAVVDDNVLYATIKAHGSEATQLVCLSADTRTGVMGPGAIYSTELEFLALTKGYLSMEAVRVTDLETGEAVDIRELPDVLAGSREE
jgi:TRAPP trafficking subunit Trs65